MLMGRPVALRTEDDLAVGGPEPRASDRDVAADLEGMLHRRPVRAGHVVVEVDDDRHADPDGLTRVGGNAADLKGAGRALGGEMRDLGRRRALAVPGDGGDRVGGGGFSPHPVDQLVPPGPYCPVTSESPDATVTWLS